MENIWATNGGIYLGYGCDHTEGEPPPLRDPLLYTGDRGIVTIAPNGAGKSRRSLLVNATMLTGWSKIIVDPKGDICAMTMAHLKRAGNLIVRWNPFDVLGLGSDGFNPIAMLDPDDDDFVDDAMGLAQALIRIEGKDPHWAQAAQEFLYGVIMWVRLMVPDGSFEDVRELVALDDTRMQAFVGSEEFIYHGQTYLGLVHAGIENDWPEIGIKTGRFVDISPENKELHSVLSEALTQMRWLDSRRIKKDLSGPKFDFSVLKKQPTTIYLILPARRFVTHSTWLRLCITSALQNLMRDTRKSNVPVLLAMDEYPALAAGDGFPIIENYAPMMRGFFVKPWIIAQDLNQLKAVHPEKWETLLANAGVLQAFATGHDQTTADYLSKLTGQTTRASLSLSSSRNRAAGQPMSRNDSISLSQIPMPLMQPQDLHNMDPGYTVFFSDKAKGTVQSYLPYPTQLRHMRDVIALDPSA